jgi:hypothetical protein
LHHVKEITKDAHERSVEVRGTKEDPQENFQIQKEKKNVIKTLKILHRRSPT